MSTHPVDPARSERGIALIIVLLLLAVMSGLAAGMTVNGHVEIAMASNETYHAGTRAAAEAGMNRAIEAIIADTTTNLLAGQDGAVDAANPGAAVNADNGSVGFLLAGAPPYALGANGQYTYSIQILDDDDPSLYPTVLSASQLVAMGNEDGNPYTNRNDRLVLRATGFGPNGTTVTVSRLLETVDAIVTTTTKTKSFLPAILVEGDLTISGHPQILGDRGSVHANGDLTITGKKTVVEQDATASGEFDAGDKHDDDDDDKDKGKDKDKDKGKDQGWKAGGEQGGGRPRVNLGEPIPAVDYLGYATHILQANGQVTDADGSPVSGTGWSHSGNLWTLHGDSGVSGTYFVYGDAKVSQKSHHDKMPLALSIIATGSIEVSGKRAFTPHEKAKGLQFVTDGDLKISGHSDNDESVVEGESRVRGQLDIEGHPEIRGQFKVYDKPGAKLVNRNEISGHPKIYYDAVETKTTTTTTTYINNVTGWMESR